MRLSSLKLAGFKSFAESTTLHFPNNRSAIVGPNGCGKSNVIDAIRWVMGESNARQLRGGSMQDVIFAGTAQRKPVGVASVELRFDNTYGKLGGAYNAYNELSIKRQVTREGKSEYFLNGTRCRRKDITDIFLGTGLGPRSYAVIEQGMINRLVDAKPDEMRVFIEEAAGVSRYQLRRKETLQHLEQTQNNLSRLHDIAQELHAQIKTLKRQAEQAERYQHLKQDIHQHRLALYNYQYSVFVKQIADVTLHMTQLTQAHQSCVKVREELEIANILLQQDIQKQLPQAEQLQQAYQHAQQQHQQVQWQLAADEKQYQHHQTKLEQLAEQRNTLQAEQQQLSNQIESLNISLSELKIALEQGEHRDVQTQVLEKLKQSYQTEQDQYQHQQQQLHVLKQQQQQLNYQIDQTEKNQARVMQQVAQLQQQYHQCIDAELQHELEDTQFSLAQEQLKLCQLQQDEEATQVQLEQQQQKRQQQQQQLQDLQSQQKSIKREIEQINKLLQNLQQEHPATAPESVIAQLELTEEGHRYSQWIEKLLQGWLWASCVSDIDYNSTTARQLRIGQSSVEQQQSTSLNAINTWIKAPLHRLWSDIYIAKDLAQAKQALSELALHQSIITHDGYWLSHDWCIHLPQDQISPAQGYLAYQSHLHQLEQQQGNLDIEIEQLKLQIQVLDEQLLPVTSHLANLNTQIKHINQQIKQLSDQQIKYLSQIEHQQQQAQQLQQQMQQLQALQQDDQQEIEYMRVDLVSLQLKLDELEPTVLMLSKKLEQQRLDLAQQQELQQQQLQRYQQVQIQLQQQEGQQALYLQDLEFKSARLKELILQQQHHQKALEDIAVRIVQQKKQSIDLNNDVEHHHQQWKAWQQSTDHLQLQQQQLQQQRTEQQQQENQLRDQLETVRLQWQQYKVEQAHVLEQIEQLGTQAHVVEIENFDEQKIKQQLALAEQQFQRLGAVNLAAFEELQQLQQRYDELTHQIEDLERTIEQLQIAMQSIDQETKHLFMKVFDQINQELQILFPKIFSGGEASLSLESDWQSGVRLMARPPGKRNSTLALLSGGEKALTALALVFAIFKLNPAPFCVLDEVDAPLDDANVDRFCNLVKELSQQVQFIYITHNKLAMTMATDLLGVTMPEAGSSRLVAVSLAQAEAYTA